MNHVHSFAVVALLLLVLAGAGCSPSVINPADIQAFQKPQAVAVTTQDYVLQPPDEIEVQCSRVPEIHMQRQLVRPDGKISFEGLGTLQAAGRTLGEVSAELRERAQELYKLESEKPIDIRVIAFRSAVYYVLGQVYVPGPKVYTGRDSVLKAVSEAQINPMAWEERIRVIRPSRDENVKAKVFKVNYRRMMARGEASKDVLLQEGDIIFVARLALIIEEFARPIGRAFSTVNIVAGPPTYRSGGTGR